MTNPPYVAAAYPHRPPYPTAVFPLLADLIAAPSRTVLDIGCGTGDLAPLVDRYVRAEQRRRVSKDGRRKLASAYLAWIIHQRGSFSGRSTAIYEALQISGALMNNPG